MESFPDTAQLAGMSISNIKSLVDSAGDDAVKEEVIGLLMKDSRAGVKAIARTLENRNLRKQNLLRKHEEMLALEKKIHTDVGLKMRALFHCLQHH